MLQRQAARETAFAFVFEKLFNQPDSSKKKPVEESNNRKNRNTANNNV